MLALPMEAPDTVEDPLGAAPFTPRVVRSTLRVLFEDTGTLLPPDLATDPGCWETLRPGSEAGPGRSEDRCGAVGAVSVGPSPLVRLQLRTSR